MKWHERTLVVLCLVMLFAICKQLSAINDKLSDHNTQQNKYSVLQYELSKVISNNIAKTQLDIARIDDRWEKQRQEEAKFRTASELLDLQMRRAKVTKE